MQNPLRITQFSEMQEKNINQGYMSNQNAVPDNGTCRFQSTGRFEGPRMMPMQRYGAELENHPERSAFTSSSYWSPKCNHNATYYGAATTGERRNSMNMQDRFQLETYSSCQMSNNVNLQTYNPPCYPYNYQHGFQRAIPMEYYHVPPNNELEEPVDIHIKSSEREGMAQALQQVFSQLERSMFEYTRTQNQKRMPDRYSRHFSECNFSFYSVNLLISC